MALLHVKLLSLRNKGIRTLSATLMVVLFFSGVFLLVLHPSHHPQEQPTLPLSADLKDVSVRALSLSSLDAAKDESPNNFTVVATTTTTTTTTSTAPREKNEHGIKESVTNNDNASKNETDEATNIQNKGGEKLTNNDKLPKENLNPNLQAEPSVNSNTTQNAEQTQTVKGDDKPQNTSQPRKAEKTREKTPTQPHTALRPSNLSRATANGSNPSPNLPKPGTGIISRKTRFQILGSNLDILPFQSFASPFIDYANEDDEDEDEDSAEKKKVITWYRPKSLADSSQKKVLREVKRRRRLLKNCRPERRCKVVYPLPRGVQADAVVFSEVDTSVDPPPRRHPDQVYILHKTRPPASRQLAAWPGSWRWTFNWTWSYRHDAHIWQPLGRLKEAEAVPPLDFFITLAEGKTRALAWIPRTCPILGQTPSKRNEFVQELRSHAPVTEFGSCSNKMCGKENISCSEFLSRKFFFLLALEDDMCKDYVTEVFYRAWQEGTYVLPVVRGGADYASYFPVGTYVDADWFKTVEQLYHFLSELIADRKLYAQLLWRKSHWIKASRKTEEVALCSLCYMLHHRNETPRNYLDAFQWSEDNGCQLQT